MYLPFTSPHYNRARQQDPRVGVVPESVKLLIGVRYKVIPLLLEPALSLLGADTLFPSCINQPTRTHHMARRPLSLLLGMRDIHSYPQARYFIPRLFSLPNSRLKHCRDLIFVQLREAQIYIGGWLQVNNPYLDSMCCPSQSGQHTSRSREYILCSAHR